MVEQTETPCRDPRNLGGEATPVARQLQFNFTIGSEIRIEERRRNYGKRKRDSERVTDSEVESGISTNSSTEDIGRNKERKDDREPEVEEEEVIQSGGGESSAEEAEEDSIYKRARSLDPRPKAIRKEGIEVVKKPTEEASTSEPGTPEGEAINSGEEETIVTRETPSGIEPPREEEEEGGSPTPQKAVVKEGIDDIEQVLIPLEKPQAEEQEDESWDITEEPPIKEGQLESSFEEIEGEEGPLTPEPAATGGDQSVSTNEKEEQPLSNEGVETKKTFTLIPKALEEPVKHINSDLSKPESEEDGPEGELEGEARRKDITIPPRPKSRKLKYQSNPPLGLKTPLGSRNPWGRCIKRCWTQ